MKKKVAGVWLAALFLLGTASIGVAFDDEGNPPSLGIRQVTAIAPEAREALSVLENERTAADALPHELSNDMHERASFGMNPDLARLAIGNATTAVYLIPARDHVCASLTFGERANVTCPSEDAVSRGQSSPATVGLAGGDIAIYGIVPDGVDVVHIETGTSESTRLATERNAYYTVVPAGTPLRTVRYEGPSGSVEFPIYDPALAFDTE